MLTFGPAFKRPPAALLALYGEFPSATVSDVLGPGYVLHARIMPLRGGMRVLGPAYTLRLPVIDNLGMHVAVRDAEPGDVIVADQQGEFRFGLTTFHNSHCTLNEIGKQAVRAAISRLRI